MARKRRSTGVNVGSASIVMIFAVLCLTVFSTLSFVTANYERRLAEKSAQAVTQYYAADWQCEDIYQQIYNKLQNGVAADQLGIAGVQASQDATTTILSYTVPIDDEQALSVKLTVLPEGAIRTDQWCVTAIRQWEYNEQIQVWDGE